MTRFPNHWWAISCAIGLEDVARGERAAGGIDEEPGLLEADRTPVLHRAERVLGDGDQVELRQRVRDPVVLLVRPEDLHGRRQGESAGLRTPGGRKDPDRHAAGSVLDAVELPDAEVEQVRRHRRRRREDPLPNPADGAVGLRLGVRDHVQVGAGAYRDVEPCLPVGPVDAREDPARAGRFAVGRQDVAAPLPRPVESEQGARVHLPFEVDRDGGASALGAGDGDLRRGGLDDERGRLAGRARGGDLEPLRVETTRARGAGKVELDRALPAEPLKIDVEDDPIVAGSRVARFGHEIPSTPARRDPGVARTTVRRR